MFLCNRYVHSSWVSPAFNTVRHPHYCGMFGLAYLAWRHSLHRDYNKAQLNVCVGSSTRQRADKSCDEECLRFGNVLLNWPPDKPKAAIYYLAKSDRLHLLTSSLTLLHRSFLHAFDYPVIVFHETDSRDLLHRKFRKRHSNIRLFFQEVQFNIPAHVNASLDKVVARQQYSIGYRHMCRFHAKQVYDQEILVGLKYVWRLDDDSLLLTTINYDLFAFMDRHRLQYGYIYLWKLPDEVNWTKYLWEAAKLYKKTRQIESQYFDSWTEPHAFFNNFEISDLSLWTS